MVYCSICLKYQNGDLGSREKEKLNAMSVGLESPNYINYDRLLLCTDCWKNVKSNEVKTKLSAESCRGEFF
tara:strand:+ start:106 stop:318 length:213 start_codon:yes stop_codon:yes gene_type:complete